MNVKFWLLLFIIALTIFSGLCWLDVRPAPTLHSAAAVGEVKQVKKLLASGVDVNMPDQAGLTPLMYAVQGGSHEVINLLLSAGVDLNRGGPQGNTALHLAAQQSDAHATEQLLSAGADFTRHNTEKATPLYLAVQSGSPAVDLLIKAGSVVDDESCAREGYLFCAVRSGNMTTLNILIERGFDLNLRTDTGACALHFAVIWKHMDAAKLLMEHGADVNIQDRYGWTPLHYAVRDHQIETVASLLEHKADTELCGNQGRNPLMMAASSGVVDIFKLLVQAGANLDAKTSTGQTAFDLVGASQRPALNAWVADYLQKTVPYRNAVDLP